jgi:hypothetical protein
VSRNPAERGRADQNHVELAKVYEDMGCSVVNTFHVGGGYPDANIGLVGITELVEFKMPDGEKTPAQKTFHRDWRGSKVRIIRCRDDVIEHVQEIRRRVAGGNR